MKRNLLVIIMLLITVNVFGTTGGNVRIYSEKNEDNSLTFFAENNAFCPVYLSITFPVLQNMSATVSLPYVIILPARATRFELFNINVINSSRPTQHSIKFTSFLGNPDTTPDASFQYLFPFEQGQRFRVTQGWNDFVSHNGVKQYAVDFAMSVGTPVHAARGGIVVSVRQDSNKGGNNRRYINDKNYIMIYHSDGTFGNYWHLMHNGVVVAPGDVVREGQLIGYSGNTGWAGGPHLHFAVTIPQMHGTMISIPFRFISNSSEGVIPRRNVVYQSIARKITVIEPESKPDNTNNIENESEKTESTNDTNGHE